MKTFQFTYIIQGYGETEEEALNDALDMFCCDPGDPSSSKDVTDQEAIIETISSEDNWK